MGRLDLLLEFSTCSKTTETSNYSGRFHFISDDVKMLPPTS
ncbi:MAG: hypothetical protein RMJ28_02830 [Nitrososphaerota archaeon]|nr:hypothetical protein [Nitrososphaerota archaeon]